MIRLVARVVVALLSDAVALIVADLLLDDVSVTASGFVISVLVFTGVAMLIQPLLRQAAFRSSPALLGSTALVATLVSLVVTVVFTDALDISGFGTWVLATVVVWFVAMAVQFLLPFVIFKEALASRGGDRGLGA